MQSSKIINHKSIDALKSIIIMSINNGEETRVLNNLKTFNLSIEKLFNLSNDKFEEILLNKERNENKNSYWNDEENYSSSFNSILIFYSECIKVAIESSKINIAREFRFSFNKILRKFLLKKKDFTLLQMFFTKQEQLFIYCIDTDNGLSNSFGFHWYYDLTFDWSNTYGLFDLDFLDIFDKQIFKYIKYAIYKRNTKWLSAWIDWLHHGIGFMDLNRFSSSKYFKSKDFIIEGKDLLELDNKFKNIDSLEKYNDFVKNFNELDEKFKSKDSINTEENERNKKEIIKEAQIAYLFHNTKHLLFSSFSYSLYKHSYDLLYQMLNTNNSSKSEVIMIGHKVLPQNINDVISMWIREDINNDEENWKFKVGDVFSENDYYDAILTFILILHLNIKENNISFDTDQYSTYELMFLKEKINYLKEKLNEIDEYKNILEKQNNNFDLEKSKEQILNILRELLNQINIRIKNDIDNSKISQSKIDEFKNGFFDEYENSSDNIKNALLLIDNNIIKKKGFDVNSKKFGLANKLPRRFFIEETNTVVDYLGKQYSEKFINAINTDVFKKIRENSEKISINEVDTIIKRIGQDNVIIFSTYYSKILSTSSSFKRSWQVQNKTYSISPSGYYEYKKMNIPIFSFSTNFDFQSILIMNKNKFFTWLDYKPTEKKQNVKNNIFLSITEKRDDKEKVTLNLYNKFELEFQKDFVSYYIEG